MIRIFISYSHADQPLRQELDKHLVSLRREGLVEVWHDRLIAPGDEWASAIDVNLGAADVILLLISADFIASTYCYEVEVREALRRHDERSAVVIPVILRPCVWQQLPFGKLQAATADGRAIVKFATPDDGFVEVLNSIRAAAERLKNGGGFVSPRTDYQSASPLPRIDSAPLCPLPSTIEITTRLKLVLKLMNDARLDAPIHVADLAKAMNFEAPSDLDAIMHGGRPPSFAFIRAFATRFGVNEEWLSSGRSTPFSPEDERHVMPEEYLPEIEKYQPQYIFFVRSKDRVGEVLIVLEVDGLKFITLANFWHISDHVGGTGAEQIFGFYKLVQKLRCMKDKPMMLGRMLDDKRFKRVLDGRMFPGVVKKGPLSHWWDDFTDVGHKWTTEESSRKAYGEGFIHAQHILREKMREPR